MSEPVLLSSFELLVSKRSLEVRDLDETVTRDKVVAALHIALGKTELGDQCGLYKRFGGVKTAVVRLTEADARSWLGLGADRGKKNVAHASGSGSCPIFRAELRSMRGPK